MSSSATTYSNYNKNTIFSPNPKKETSFNTHLAKDTKSEKKKKSAYKSIAALAGREILSPSVGVVSLSIYQIAKYRFNLAEYILNKNHRMFTKGPIIKSRLFCNLYKTNKGLGRFASNIALAGIPKNYVFDQACSSVFIKTCSLRFTRLASKQIYADVLRKTGARQFSKSAQLSILGRVMRIATNNVGSDKNASFTSQLGSNLDSISAAFVIVSRFLANKGNHHFELANFLNSGRLLRYANVFGILNSLALSGSSMARLYEQFKNVKEGKSLNSSSIYYAAADFGLGLTGFINSNYLLKAARSAKNAKDASTMLNGIVSWPTKLNFCTRMFGFLGSAPTAVFNANNLRDAQTNPKLSSEERHEKLISSSLGLTGSLLLVTGSGIMAPAIAPVAGTLRVAGTVFMIAQAMFDYRKELLSSIWPKRAEISST